MYRRPKFLDVLLQIRREMALEAEYDVVKLAELVRLGSFSASEINKNPDAATAQDDPVSETQSIQVNTTSGVSL